MLDFGVSPPTAALASSSSALAVSPMCALAVAQTRGAQLFARRPPVRSAIGAVTLGGASLTEAAHHARFFDSAHLTRTCRTLLGVAPKSMLPQDVYATLEI